MRDALAWGAARDGDAGSPPGSTSLHRERTGCCAGWPRSAREVLENPDVETIRGELHRLVADLEHHLQRLHDLVYDSVSLELGGSE